MAVPQPTKVAEVSALELLRCGTLSLRCAVSGGTGTRTAQPDVLSVAMLCETNI
jgi:hypothetical protein